MPMRSEIESLLREHRSILQEKFRVEKIGLCGSDVRGEEKPGSDIDLLVRFSSPIGWEFIDLKDYLEGVFDRRVDLVTEAALKPKLKGSILREVIYP